MFNGTYSIIVLIVALALGIIPAVIASKKYYNSVGFYIYGVIGFLPALIHTILLPDQSNGNNTRKASTGAIVTAAFAGVFTIYLALMQGFDVIENITWSGLGFYRFVEGFFGIATAFLCFWLVGCMYSCNRNKGIKLNFIISAVLSLIEPFILLIVYTIHIKSTGKITLGIFAIFMRELSVGRYTIIMGVALCAAFAILAVFIHRLNAGLSVMPKGLYCLMPGVIVMIASLVIQIFTFRYADSITLASSFLRVISMFLVGGYCWAVSNIPSETVVYDQIQSTQPMV